MEFEWDEGKAAGNLRKHGIPFEYATTVFDDAARFERPDFDEAYGEERWLVIGLAGDDELAVVYTIRGFRTRLISARGRHRMSDENTGKTVTYSHDPANPPQLNAEQRERLDAMREQDIDVSDIPAQNDLHAWKRPGLFGGAEGRLRLAALKEKVLVLDGDVAEFFSDEGAGAPDRMNAVLREYVKTHRKSA